MIWNLVKGIIFFFPTVLGILGNVFVFVNYILFLGGTEMKSIHFILIHLAFANSIMLFAEWVPKTIAALGQQNFLHDTGCKIVIYMVRVARGLSICTSGLLTVVQAVTISPTDSMWRRLKLKSPWHILPIFVFFWILNSLISMNLPFSVISINSVNISQISKGDKYCYFLPEGWIIRWTFLTLMVLRDAVFQAIMSGASGYLIFALHKHHQHVLYLQSSNVLYRAPPEIKAAQSVLLLMLCFLVFYWSDCAFSMCFSYSLNIDSVILNIHKYLTLGYAILSPFVLIHRDGRLGACFHSQEDRKAHRNCRSY
ncbi:PREDICTED: vomeronasal type-1 receptor 4-like [Chinchilla lanigera]|uniref:vomeronasal type-1 receptor 4-like n=1 Tax=Chinchilla lanigera TaxID=34839 RepID=UPI00038EE1E0|nr:PREDICTED: vomeronasal type-1 receptor 4-like [Chinchilla lanigera]